MVEIAFRRAAAAAALLAFSGACAFASVPLSDDTAPSLLAWLSARQYARTGLVASYDGDPMLKDVSFTYDQALAALAFTQAGEHRRAARVLSFFLDRAQWSGGAFVTAYDTKSGRPWEHRVHAGPNAWLGIACLQYEKRSGDAAYRVLAVSLADWLISLQSQDPEKGIRGGPDATWFSTEHQLDAYAFFSMLADITGKPAYRDAAIASLAWLRRHAWNPETHEVKRGLSDSKVAADVYTWTVAALGPGRLREQGLDPEGLMARLERYCGVEAAGIEGFDFTDPDDLGREPVVSSEWTAQAILAYKILGMQDKAEHYLSELGGMARQGGGGTYLPYATAPLADTGHGWKTPDGADTGSVAGTAWAFFALKGFNPFDLSA